MWAVGLALTGIALAATLTLNAMKENMMFFIAVSDVVAGEFPEDRNFRVGGLVVDGSVHREPGSLLREWRGTERRCERSVRYTGVLPDLFREGQGVVAHGRIGASGDFEADTILAKHDENYMAPEVAESLAEHVSEQTAGLAEGSAECDNP